MTLMPSRIAAAFVAAVEACPPAADTPTPLFKQEEKVPIEQSGMNRAFVVEMVATDANEECNTVGETKRWSDHLVLIRMLRKGQSPTTFHAQMHEDAQKVQQYVVEKFKTTGFCTGVENARTNGPARIIKTPDPKAVLLSIPFHIEYVDTATVP